MNERIKELVDQAGLTFVNAITDDNEDIECVADTDGGLPCSTELEKFAELIVKECMSQIEEVRQIKAGNAGPVYTQGFEDGMFVAIRTIEEHFGVEE